MMCFRGLRRVRCERGEENVVVLEVKGVVEDRRNVTSKQYISGLVQAGTVSKTVCRCVCSSTRPQSNGEEIPCPQPLHSTKHALSRLALLSLPISYLFSATRTATSPTVTLPYVSTLPLSLLFFSLPLTLVSFDNWPTTVIYIYFFHVFEKCVSSAAFHCLHFIFEINQNKCYWFSFLDHWSIQRIRTKN